jgi:ABC-type multidrug transport system permease subunit
MGMSDAAGFIKQKFFSQMLKFYKQRNGGSVLQGFYDSIPIAMFILLPIFAFILKLLYLKKGRFSHHLVFSFYFFSFLFMAFTLLIIANFIYELPDILIMLSLFSIFFYLLLALKRFYKQGWFLSLIKTSIATFSFLMFVVPLAIILVGIATFMFY